MKIYSEAERFVTNERAEMAIHCRTDELVPTAAPRRNARPHERVALVDTLFQHPLRGCRIGEASRPGPIHPADLKEAVEFWKTNGIYQPADGYVGSRAGFVFRMDSSGLGYYLDSPTLCEGPPLAKVTLSLQTLVPSSACDVTSWQPNGN